jgi:hypothetical protein
MKHSVRGKLVAAFRAQQEAELAAAPACRRCGKPIGRYVPTRLTRWEPRPGGYAMDAAGLETDGDIGACTCPEPLEGSLTR